MPLLSALNDLLSKLGLKIGNLKLPENLHISILSNNSIFSNNKKVVIEKNQIFFNLPKFNKEEKKALLNYVKAIKESEEDFLLLEKKSFETLEDIYSKKSEFSKLDKYKDIFLPEDFSALEGAVYIKQMQNTEKRRQIPVFKEQIRNKFGERGNTICNLYSAGYFDQLLFPLYETLAKEDGFTTQNFQTIFDKLIRDFPLAIFINRTMTIIDVKDRIVNRIEINKRYGVKQAHIHGIGRINCENIKQAIKELEDEHYEFTKSINEKNTIIIATLSF